MSKSKTETGNQESKKAGKNIFEEEEEREEIERDEVLPKRIFFFYRGLENKAKAKDINKLSEVECECKLEGDCVHDKSAST